MSARARPLRVGLNLVFLGERAGGVGRYAAELPAALLEAEPDTELHVFVARDAPMWLRAERWAGDVRWATLPVSTSAPVPNVLAQFLLLPVLARARRLAVLHSPANTGPVIAPGVASIVTLHDLIWLHRADEWEPSRRVQRRMRAMVRHCVRHADRIFVDSRAVAEDLTRTLRVASERIDVAPLGVRVPDARPISAPALRARLALDGARVLLCVAQKRPYKNLGALLRAMPSLPSDVVLVLPGQSTGHEQDLRALADELGVAARVRFPDWLSDEELEALYALASAFVLPTLIEGFGLPVLEAMARGVPVACSDIEVLREVAGDAALLFDPANDAQVVACVRRLLEDRGLVEQLIVRGRERARAFSWRRTGEASLAGYRRALEARSSALRSRAIS